MSPQQPETAGEIEAAAAIARSRLRATAAALRARSRPEAIAASVLHAVQERSASLRVPVSERMVDRSALVVTGLIGAVTFFQMGKRSREAASAQPASRPEALAHEARSAENGSNACQKPSADTQTNGKAEIGRNIKTLLLSIMGISTGYFLGAAIAPATVERHQPGQPSNELRHSLDRFVDAYAMGMKKTAANLFGVSRLAAAGLVFMAVVANQFPSTSQRQKDLFD